ncbi:nischarin isoform X2 [Engraulis encrasicolus]|uniref:nischarin isoform X2 n=1 Tax=Engraulis encrasicolus TaxID=184585 RepID=UPI002FD30FC7
MDCDEYPEENLQKRVHIVGSELVDNYTVYIIEVSVGDHKWTVKHRYSDFHDLHEKLTAEKKVDKHLLPPKKMIGKNSKSLVEKRQKELEVYLQTLLSRCFPTAAPKGLSSFLHFHSYEINGIAAALAEELYHRGEQLLVAGEVFVLRPLQLYAVTQQLRLAKPTCASGDAKADLGHILDFTCRLRYLKIPGKKGVVGTSNIQEDSLPFDLSVFKSLLQIEIDDCDSSKITGLPSLRPSLATLSVHRSTSTMKDVIVPEASEFAQWVPEGVDTDCPVTAIIPVWKSLTTLDFSNNQLMCIDESVKLIPQVEFLDLSHNQLPNVENLQHLYNLIHLDLSYNNLTVLEGVHTKLGNIKTLNLAGNQIKSLSGLNKLYSLVNLDLSSNCLAQIEEIKPIGLLPCLEKLSLANNPMCIIPDYRTKVLAQFWDRASEVCLDHTVTTEKELDTVEVLKAIQKAKEAKDRMANNDKKISEDSRQADSGGGGVPPTPPMLSHHLPRSSGSPCSSSFSSSSSSNLAAPPAPPASTSASASASPPTLTAHSASCSQVVLRDDAIANKKHLTLVDSDLSPKCWNTNTTSCEKIPQVTTQEHDSCLPCEVPSEEDLKCNTSSCSCCTESVRLSTDGHQTHVLPCWLLSYSPASSPEFAHKLSALVTKVAQEASQGGWGLHGDALAMTSDLGEQEAGQTTATGAGEDGYFEMGPDSNCSTEEDGGGSALPCSSSPTSSSPASPPDPPHAEGQATEELEKEKEEEEEAEEEVVEKDIEEADQDIIKMLWAYCVRVQGKGGSGGGVSHLTCCLALTKRLLVVFRLRGNEQPAGVEELLEGLQVELVAPYAQVEALWFCVPDTCLSLRLASGSGSGSGSGSDATRWHFFADSAGLKEVHAAVGTLLVKGVAQLEQQAPTRPLSITQLLWQHLHSWEWEESDGAVKVGHAAHLLDPHGPVSHPQPHADILSHWCTSTPTPTGGSTGTTTPDPNTNTTDGSSSEEERLSSVPCILFLTPRHLCVLKVDFQSLVEHDGPEGQGTRCCSRLTRIPLSAVLLSPKQDYCPSHNGPPPAPVSASALGSLLVPGVAAVTTSTSTSSPHVRLHDGHMVALMAGSQQLTAVFILPHDKFLFLRTFSQYRAGLRDIKTVAFLHSKATQQHGHGHGHSRDTARRGSSPRPAAEAPRRAHKSSKKPLLALSVHYPSETLLQKLSEENQSPTHLTLSPSLLYISHLQADELVDFFHNSIAEVENEELKHILWSSVLFYKSPEVEMAACVMLSTKALYFILDDTASTLSDQAYIWSWQPSQIAETDFIISYCFAFKLCDLHSVNVGLFDQYFRVVGQSADHIISCLSRDSYGTHRFLQQLMTVLSLLEKVPSPEPADSDFYAQFGNKTTGKMENYELVHSSKVKFVYPSEEEIGDLTFVVAERKAGRQGSPPRSFHILLYLLVFEVQLQSPLGPGSGSGSGSGSAPDSSSSSASPQPVLVPKTLILTATDVFLLDEDHISYPLPHFAKEPPQRERYRLADARRIRDLDRVLMGYQTYPQAVTLVFDDVPAGPDLLCHLTMDHFSDRTPDAEGSCGSSSGSGGSSSRAQTMMPTATSANSATAGPNDGEVQWCVFVPAADGRERLISLLARQWEVLCSRELPVELTG